MGPASGGNSAQVQSAVTVRVTGEATKETVPAVVAAIDQAVAGSPDSSVLMVDLRAVSLLTASGIDPLITLAERYTTRGLRCCAVVTPGSPSALVLAAAGARGVLAPFANLDQAMTGADGGDVEVLSKQFETLTRALLGTRTIGVALQHVVDATMTAIPSAAMVSVTLWTPGGEVHTPVHTDDVAAELDRVQYLTGLGPSLDAAHPAGPAYAESHDLTAEQRWPQFATAAVTAGYQAVHSTELLPGLGPNRPTGGLNIYFRDPHELDDTHRHTVLLLATHAALALAHARSTELADLHDFELHRAIDTRDVIGQAKGILMHRQNIDADQAFDLLRHTSQDLNVKLVDIARNLIDHHTELDR